MLILLLITTHLEILVKNQRDIGQKSQFFHTPPASALRGSCQNFAKIFHTKNYNGGATKGEKV